MQLPIPGLESFSQASATGGAGNYDPRIRQLLEAGVDPRLIRTIGVEGASKTTQGTKGATEALGSAQGFLGDFISGKKPGLGRTAFIGGLIPGVMEAGSELQAGRPTGALAALGAGAITSAAGAALLKAPHPLAKVAGGALLLGGSMIPGAAAKGAESVKRKATGEPTSGDDSFSNQLAMNRQIAELGTTQYRDNMGVYTSMMRDLNRDASNQAHLDLQRNIPLINQMKNAELIRSQALINTQNQAYLQQGVVATAGALATGAQQQTGATVRQALATSPYNIALQSPAISFG
jgi:hypothetical protein